MDVFQRFVLLLSSYSANLYLEGPLLAAVQTGGLFSDSKTFVDMPLRHSPDVVSQEFNKLRLHSKSVSREELRRFVDEHFYPAGHELEEAELPDWTESPELLSEIDDEHLRKWASALNQLWKRLARKVKPDVGENPDRHSLLYVPNPFIVPGDRFREFYYWDTYWIVKGLLATNMTQTVRGILENFIYVFNKHHLVPNGGRVYYLNRSQPPLLTPMVHQYFRKSRDIDFLRDNIRALEDEYNWWMQKRAVEVTIDGEVHRINRYNVQIAEPRPEGYKEDAELIKGLNQEEATEVLSNVASACESGQDFSSRWFAMDTNSNMPNTTLRAIRTRHIAPVDLNVFLGMCENMLSEFFVELGDDVKRETYSDAFAQRLRAISALFWDPAEKVWFDLDLQTHMRRPQFYPSNAFPLLLYPVDAPDAMDKVNDVVTYLKKEGVLDYPGGVPSSQLNTGEQWDLPNVWPPSMSLLIEALSSLPSTDGRRVAYLLAQKWVKTNFRLWNATGHMYEKYNAVDPGSPGGGGEYEVQVGFGWSNGFVLELLERFGHELKL